MADIFYTNQISNKTKTIKVDVQKYAYTGRLYTTRISTMSVVDK